MTANLVLKFATMLDVDVSGSTKIPTPVSVLPKTDGPSLVAPIQIVTARQNLGPLRRSIRWSPLDAAISNDSVDATKNF